MIYIATLDLWDVYIIPEASELESAGLVEVIR